MHQCLLKSHQQFTQHPLFMVHLDGVNDRLCAACHLQVCSRLGLDCGVKVVEDGRYCLLWPRPAKQPQQQEQQEVQQEGTPGQQTLLSVGGDACVIDVYGEGALLPVREVSTTKGQGQGTKCYTCRPARQHKSRRQGHAFLMLCVCLPAGTVARHKAATCRTM